MLDVKSLIKGGLVVVISNIVLKAMSFLLLPLYTKYLTPADYGVVDIANTFISLFVGFGALCLDTGFYTFYYDEKGLAYENKVFNSVFWIHIFVSIIPILLLLFSKPIALLLYNSKDMSLVVSISLLVISTSLVSIIPNAKLRINNRMGIYSKLNICISFISIILNIIFVIKLKMGYYALISTTLITNLIQMIIYYGLFKKEINIQSFNFNLAREILKFTVPLIPGSIAFWIVTLSDRYFINYFCSQYDVGLYAIANKLVTILTIFTGAFITVWPSFLFSNKNEQNNEEKYKLALNYFFFIFSCLSLIISVFSKEIVMLMSTESYWSSYKMVGYLVFGELAIGMASISGAGLSIAKKSTYVMFVSWAIATINIILNLIFMPKYGSIVAAITTMTCYFLGFYFNYIFSQKFYPVNFDMQRIIPIYFILIILSNLMVDFKLLVKIPMVILILSILCFSYRKELYDILKITRSYLK